MHPWDACFADWQGIVSTAVGWLKVVFPAEPQPLETSIAALRDLLGCLAGPVCLQLSSADGVTVFSDRRFKLDVPVKTYLEGGGWYRFRWRQSNEFSRHYRLSGFADDFVLPRAELCRAVESISKSILREVFDERSVSRIWASVEQGR
jgi:hypothetical protein